MINNDVVLAVPYGLLALVLLGAAAGVAASLVPLRRIGTVPAVAAMAES